MAEHSQHSSSDQQPGGPDPEIASDHAMMHVLWSRGFPRSSSWGPTAACLDALQKIPSSHARERAAFFLACQPFIDQLALQSPVEPELLGPYPFNPFPKEEWPQRFREAGFSDWSPDALMRAGLQLASKTLLLEYL
jgi:hypothetical protein